LKVLSKSFEGFIKKLAQLCTNQNLHDKHTNHNHLTNFRINKKMRDQFGFISFKQ